MIIKSEDKTVEGILNRPFLYEVPRFQRSFSWEREQVEAFWEDIMETMEEKREDYFLGSFIFRQKSEKKIEIIDGQQRMALLTIFFCCIRDKYSERGESYSAGQIESQYIARRLKPNKEREYKLVLNEQDRSYFQDYVQRRGFSDKKKFLRQRGTLNSHKLMKSAYDFLWEKISNEVDKHAPLSEEATNYLSEIEDIVATRFKAITTLVDDDSEAYLIFETLNDRGLDLSIADLLKNYLYFKAGDQNLDIVQQDWDDVTSSFDISDLNNFLRHYWSSSKELIREKRLYKAFRKDLTGPKEVREFVNRLREEAKVYKGLINPTYDFWGDNLSTVNLLKDLKNLGVKQIYPLLLSAYSQLNESEFRKLVSLSLNLTFRYSTICNFNPNQLEKKYSDLGIAFRKGTLKLYEIQAILKALDPSDEDFIRNFEKKQIRKGVVARYILKEIIKHEIKGGEEIAELIVEGDQEKVNLEHIMPKNLSQWKQYIKKHKINDQDLLHRIGNLTLLSSPRNKEGSNKLFSVKCKETYSKSNIPMTKELCKYKEWDETIINERQKKMAEIANKVWRA